MTLKTIIATGACITSNSKAMWFLRKQGATRLAIRSTSQRLNMSFQDIIAGATYMMTRMMKKSRVIKEKWPVVAGQFENTVKMRFTIPGTSSYSQYSKPFSFFQLASSLNYKVNGVFHA
mgnify:CR=1 FL=1